MTLRFPTAAFTTLCLTLSACIGSGVTDPGTVNTIQDNRRAFPAVWISASWSAGVAGAPTAVSTVLPSGYFGTLCAVSSLVIENHPTKYANLTGGGAQFLVIGSSCTLPVNLAVCRNVGSSGTTSPPLGPCAAEPRQSLIENVQVQRVGAATTTAPVAFGATSLNVAVEIFMCSDLSDFNFRLAAPKFGVAQTDCVEK